MKKQLVSALLALTLCLGLCIPVGAVEFTDVPQNSVFHQAIQNCVEQGLLKGYDNGTFLPDKNVTRAQFAVMLARIFYPGEADSGAYDKWKSVGWYAPSCAVLKSHGAMVYEDQYWQDPEVMGIAITRRDMALFLNATLKAGDYRASESDKQAAQERIPDFDEVGDYCADGTVPSLAAAP